MSWIGDSICDVDCNVAACSYDNGDCDAAHADSMSSAQLTAVAATCGITLDDVPCSSGVDIAVVDNSMTLAGVTVKQFDNAAQTAFTKGLATTAGVEEGRVMIAQFQATSRRSSGISVESKVTLVGTEATGDKASAISTKLSDKDALQSNIQAQAGSGTALKAATVESSSSSVTTQAGTGGFNSGGGSSGGSSSGGGALLIIILCVVGGVVVVGAIGGAVYMMQNKGDSGDGGGGTVAVKMEVNADETPPPGGVYMKNGMWMDEDGKPVDNKSHPGIQ